VNKDRPRAILAEHFSQFTFDESDDVRFSVLSAERLIELVVECEVDLSPYASDYQQRVDALLTRSPFLKIAAGRLLSMPGTANWFADLDRKQQIWESPTIPSQDSFNVDLCPFNQDVTKPRAAFWTSTRIGSYSSSWISYLRRGEDGRPAPYYPWRLEASAAARVYEVHEPEAWYSLCLAFPRHEKNKYIAPDWKKVARTWDGVHVSVGGLLTTELVCWKTAQGRTRLSGWNVESTVWLRWAFTHSERLPDID